MRTTTQVYAGFWIRALAFVFDYLIIAIYLVLLTVLGFTVNSAFPNIARILFGNPFTGQATGFLLITLPVTLYFALSESSPSQATWGKKRLHLKVVNLEGTRISRARSFGRTILKFIPWELAHTCIWQISFAPENPSPLILAGFVLVWLLVGANIVSLVVSKTDQALYDRIAETYVVRT